MIGRDVLRKVPFTELGMRSNLDLYAIHPFFFSGLVISLFCNFVNTICSNTHTVSLLI